MTISQSAAILDMLPHGPAIRFLRSIEEATSTSLRARVQVAPDASNRASVCSTVMIEYMGQAVAAHMAWNKSAGCTAERLKPAFIAKIRDFSLQALEIEVACNLDVSVCLSAQLGEAAEYSGEVRYSNSGDTIGRAEFLVQNGPA